MQFDVNLIKNGPRSHSYGGEVPFKTKFKVLVNEVCGWKISKIWNIIGFMTWDTPISPMRVKYLQIKQTFENRLMVLSLK